MKLPIVTRKDYEHAKAELNASKQRVEALEEYNDVLETLIKDCLGVRLEDHLPNAIVTRQNKKTAQNG